MLSPFFAKCDGVLLVDPDDAQKHEFRPSSERTGEAICDLVVVAGVTKLICGFIDEADRNRLSALGVDIRLGSCSRSVTMLARDFDILPKA